MIVFHDVIKWTVSEYTSLAEHGDPSRQRSQRVEIVGHQHHGQAKLITLSIWTVCECASMSHF